MIGPYPENRLSWRLTVHPLRYAFRFEGRSTRTEVGTFYLLSFFAPAIGAGWHNDQTPFLYALLILWWAVWEWPWIPLFVRRVRDQDRSPWWGMISVVQVLTVLILFLLPASPVPTGLSIGPIGGETHNVAWSWQSAPLIVVGVVSSVMQLILFLSAGTPGTNRYGTDPRLDGRRDTSPSTA